jgi:hypothetical protein
MEKVTFPREQISRGHLLYYNTLEFTLHNSDRKYTCPTQNGMTLLADRINSTRSLPEITARLKESVKDMSLDVTVHDSEVFQYMHRV